MYSNRSNTNWKTYSFSGKWLNWLWFQIQRKSKPVYKKKKWRVIEMIIIFKKKIIPLKEHVCHAVNFRFFSVYFKNLESLIWYSRDITQERKEMKGKCKISTTFNSHFRIHANYLHHFVSFWYMPPAIFNSFLGWVYIEA